MNETLIFFKIVLLAFNILIPKSFSVIEATFNIEWNYAVIFLKSSKFLNSTCKVNFFK